MNLNNFAINYANGDTYLGQVTPTYPGFYVPHGIGTKTFRCGDVYHGNFVYDQFNGYGNFKSLNGDYYKGYYTNNQPNGSGESYQAANQRHYIGTFRMGVEDGNAVITKVDYAMNGGTKKYEGEVRDGKRQGRGKLYVTQLDGQMAWFDGTWFNDLLNGYGTQTVTAGRCFMGIFVNGYLEGQGTCRAEDGKNYSVIFSRGVVTKWI
jgi:hypothetical protein